MTALVLLVDDDPDVLRVLSRGLTRKGFRVHCASAADSAYAALESEAVDAVVLDVFIPQMTGDTLALAITRHWPRLVGRVLLMSGDPERLARLQLHGNNFPTLAKPFSVAELADRLTAMLTRRPEGRRDGTTNGLHG
jgi:DNA-binding response OmpR family regulator